MKTDNKIIVTTSWDDGHKFDVKLAKLLKKYGIKGTFYISPKNREFSEKDLLSEKEIVSLSKNFEIGAHTMTHVNLNEVTTTNAKKEIEQSKHFLEKLIHKKVVSFCYPYGSYKSTTKNIVKKIGFKLARTTNRFNSNHSDPFELHTSLHTYNHYSDILKILKFSKGNLIKFLTYLNWENLAKDMFDEVYKKGGVFHLWGHSWEVEKNRDWEKLENVLAYISLKKDVLHETNSELVTKKRKKKLLLITPYFYPKIGGMENYALNIAQGLMKKYRWEVVVITSNHSGGKQSVENIKGIKIYRLKTLFKISNTPINPLWYFHLKKIIQYEKPDIINSHSPVPFISDVAANVAGEIPFVLTYHAGKMKKEKFIFDILIAIYEKVFLQKVFKRADKIICSSEFVKYSMTYNYLHKSVVISPAVDTTVFKPTDKENSAVQTVLFVGRNANVYRLKGLYYLIDAMKKIPNAVLNIVGETISTSEKNVSFLGVKTGIDLVREMQKSTILVLPSLAHMESFGMVLIEAMACKTPVIGTNIGGIPEVISQGKDGILVPSKDSSALQDAIETILNDKKLAKKMGENGYKKIKRNFEWEKKVSETQNIFSSLL